MDCLQVAVSLPGAGWGAGGGRLPEHRAKGVRAKGKAPSVEMRMDKHSWSGEANRHDHSGERGGSSDTRCPIRVPSPYPIPYAHSQEVQLVDGEILENKHPPHSYRYLLTQ